MTAGQLEPRASESERGRVPNTCEKFERGGQYPNPSQSRGNIACVPFRPRSRSSDVPPTAISGRRRGPFEPRAEAEGRRSRPRHPPAWAWSWSSYRPRAPARAARAAAQGTGCAARPGGGGGPAGPRLLAGRTPALSPHGLVPGLPASGVRGPAVRPSSCPSSADARGPTSPERSACQGPRPRPEHAVCQGSPQPMSGVTAAKGLASHHAA
jgi:hypothetical protein